MYLQCCTQQQLNEIYAEFGVTEESLKQDATSLIDWLEKQPHLPNIKDEQFIINLLLRCKASIERTKKQLNDFYTGKAILAKVLPERDMDSKLKLAKDILVDFGFYTPIPKLTPEGYRILIVAFRENITKIPSADDLLQTLLLVLHALWKLDRHKSVIVIYDVKNVTMPMSSTFVVFIPKIIKMVYKTARFRFFKFYLLNMSPRYEYLLALFKTIMPAKEVKKIEFWKKEPKDLIKVLPKDVLPAEYGGTEKSVKECAALWYKELETLKDWLSSEENVIADLDKIPQDRQHNTDVSEAYGVEGTFKKLAVD